MDTIPHSPYDCKSKLSMVIWVHNYNRSRGLESTPRAINYPFHKETPKEYQ